MKIYSYDGPVYEFERLIANNWKATTKAVSEKQARNNIAYQFKSQYGRVPRSNITVPGKLTVINGEGESK